MSSDTSSEGEGSHIYQVAIVPLKKVVTERGHLLEVQRQDDWHFPGFGQAYVTCTYPGVVKAWYCHRAQVDQIALAHGAVTLVLFDARADSPTFRHVIQCDMSDENPALVQIPPGVWHGFRASGPAPAYLLHLNSTAWDESNLDEERLPPDTPEIPYAWP